MRPNQALLYEIAQVQTCIAQHQASEAKSGLNNLLCRLEARDELPADARVRTFKDLSAAFQSITSRNAGWERESARSVWSAYDIVYSLADEA